MCAPSFPRVSGSSTTTTIGIDRATGNVCLQPLESCAPITPSSNPPKGFEGSGEGKLITLREGLSLDECVRRVKTLLGLKYRVYLLSSAAVGR